MKFDLTFEFVSSAAMYDQCLGHIQKEIAFVGASNAGKSSAINALSNKRKLAKVSKTPGKTKLFNLKVKILCLIVNYLQEILKKVLI